MKHLLLFFCLLSSALVMATGQTKNQPDNVVITNQKGKTQALTNDKGELLINVSPEDTKRFIANGFVCYKDFGAKGDGKTDDMDAIAATHAFANQQGLSVAADEGATYYIGGKNRPAIIRTNTNFGKSSFIIDDTNVENRNAHIFIVSSGMQPFKPAGISSLKRNQEKLDVPMPGTCLITVTNSNVKRYIRFGPNQNNGSSQTDIFIVDKNSKVDMNAPIIWDFDHITDITALPIDETTLTVTGGRFTTIANNAESKYTYYSRGIAIRRSNVIVDGLEHRITGEGDHGAPYGGFIHISDCSYVTVRNTLLTGHKVYQTIGSAGVPVSMGTYDISVNRALNVSFVNCTQTNDIKDSRYWGIMGSNFCKNLVYDKCTFSRFDAHMGVANATIRNSTLGHQGINAIGSGTFTVENSTIMEGALSICVPTMAVHGRENLLSATAFLCPQAEHLSVPALSVGHIPGSTILATPVTCLNVLPLKPCISTIPNIRKIIRDRLYLEI